MELTQPALRKPKASFQAAKYHGSCLVEEEDLLPAAGACPVCGFSGERARAFALQASPPVDLLACRCGCCSASRMPRADFLKKYYSNYYQAEATSTFDGSERFSRHLWRLLRMRPKAVIHILDFGGGVDAAVARALAKEFLRRGTQRVDIVLVDYNACATVIDDGRITVTSRSELTSDGAENAYDVVLASAIVEHLPEPRDVILKLLKCIGPEGSAYFRTPAMRSLVRLAARLGVTVDFTYPGHLHDMGQAFWEGLLKSLRIDAIRLVHSRPSIVETTIQESFGRTLAAYVSKAPWYILRKRYTLVGGWEAVFSRAEATAA